MLVSIKVGEIKIVDLSIFTEGFRKVSFGIVEFL